jgi:hypothetical protein
MILQFIHWADMAGTVVEGLLLIRMLTLRLQRTYAFVTLYWAVNLIFDAAAWRFGWESSQTAKLQLYGLFLTAVLLPLVAWDAFEEMRKAIGKIRMLHASRMVSALFVTVVLAAFWSFINNLQSDAQAGSGTAIMAILLWFGSACASLLFLWTLRRFVQKQSIATPRNTSVWEWLFLIVFMCQILDFVSAPAGETASRMVGLIVGFVSVCAMMWALIRIRAVPDEISSEPQIARL